MHKNPMRVPNYALWPMESFGDITNFMSRGSAPGYVGSSSFYAVGQRCISTKGFKAEKSRPHDPRQMSSLLIPREGDVLINSTGTGTIGRSCVFPGGDEFAVDGHVTLLRVRNEMADPRWVNAILLSAWGQSHLENQCYSGSTNQVELSRARLASTSVPLPPLGEQRKIAEVLGAVDSRVQATEHLIAKRKALQRGVVDDLFFDRSSWNCKRLGSLLAVGPKNGFSPSEVEDWTGVRVLGLGCLMSDGFTPRQLKNVPLIHANMSSALLEDGDLLMSRANTRDLVGLVGRYEDVGGACLYPDLMMRLKPNNKVIQDFLEHSLRHSYVRRQIMAHAVGTSESMVKISSAIVRNLCVAVPSFEEQRRIVSVIEVHDERIAAERARLEKLRKIKAGLMDDLLTGRVRVNQLQELPV